MTADVFRECRERVSARDAAQRYGIEVNRYGKALCPFHSEKTPSMSFRNGRFKCFGCGVSGDAINFTARLFGLTPLAAVERLNADFALSLPLHRKQTAEEAREVERRMEIARAHKAFEEWRKALIYRLCEAFRLAHDALLNMEDLDELTEREALAIRTQTQIDHWLDILSGGTMDEKMQLFRMRQEVKLRVDKILSNTPMKSGAA